MTGGGDGFQLAKDEPCQSLIADLVFVGELVEIKQVFQFVNGQQTIQQVRTILAADDLRLRGFILCGQFAHNGFEHVKESDEPQQAPVFINDQSFVQARLTHHFEHAGGRAVLRHKNRLLDERGQVKMLSHQMLFQHIFGT